MPLCGGSYWKRDETTADAIDVIKYSDVQGEMPYVIYFPLCPTVKANYLKPRKR